MKEILTDAIRYWEPRRIVYNAVLFGVTLAVFLSYLPGSTSRLNINTAQLLFIAAVLANVVYCAAYVVDIAAQLSEVRPTWRRYRWILLVIGIIFAVIIARAFAHSLFI